MSALAQKLARAVQRHQAGDLRGAESLYSEILRADPQNVDALHLLGLIAGQFGRHDLGCQLIQHALRLRPDFADAHNNLGNELRSDGKLPQAIASYQTALRLKPSFAEAHNNLGNALVEQGRIQDAVEHLHEAVRLKPDFALAHQSLGNTLLKLQRLDDAVSCFRQVVRLQPINADAHNNLAFALHGLGRLNEAENACLDALRIKPDSAEALVNLANIHQDQGRLAEAVAGYETALRLNPGFAEAHNNLGNAFRGLGNLDLAVASYRRALALRPDYADAHNNLGSALRAQDNLDDAIASCRDAIRLKPDFAEAHNNMGYILQEIGFVNEALASYEHAIQFKPTFADAHNNRGAALLSLGRIQAGIASVSEALRLAPGFPMAYYLLARLARDGKYAMSDVELDGIRKALALQQGSRNKSLLHFALAYLLERQGDYDEAFKHYEEGNALKRRAPDLRAFDIAAHRQEVDRITASFDGQFFARMAPLGHPSEVPIFIVGMPRSGTSLVEQILSSHPQIGGAGELTEIGAISSKILCGGGRREASGENVNNIFARQSPQAIRHFAERYLRRLQRDYADALRVCDKMPQNFIHLGLIAVLFPHARIIHCLRDPRDICVSCFCENFEKLTFTSSLEELGQYYREYERLVAHWRRVLPLPMLEIRYEDVIANQDESSRRLIDFCGVAWNDRCLAFHTTNRPVQTASNLQVRKPIYGSSVGRWRRFEAHVGKFLDF